MEENTYLPQSDINGIWKASYSKIEGLSEPDADPEEQATILFDNGFLSGTDPFGGKYSGLYSVKEGKFAAKVEVVSSDPEMTSILDVEPPFTLELFGDYSSPDHFSIAGRVTGLEVGIIINCRRVTESSVSQDLSSVENEKSFVDDSSFEKDGR